ncbi:TPA: hypothetical protein ACFPCC_000850 [Neisseria meningitidis]
MFKKSRVPVRVFRSSDKGAPQNVVGASDNAFKILNACLVEGYGDTASLGWELKFKVGSTGIFMPTDKKQTGWGLRISQSEKYGARVSAVRNPSSDDTFELESAYENNEAYFLHDNTNGDTKTRDWTLVGHSLGFILIFHVTEHSSDGPFNTTLYFGCVPTLAAADDHNYLLCYSTDGSYRYLSYRTRNSYLLMARDYLGLNLGRYGTKSKTEGISHRFPARICNGFWCDDVYITEQVESEWEVRGYLPGIMNVVGDAYPYDRKVLEDFDGSGDSFLYLRFYGHSSSPKGQMVNLTAWEV